MQIDALYRRAYPIVRLVIAANAKVQDDPAGRFNCHDLYPWCLARHAAKPDRQMCGLRAACVWARPVTFCRSAKPVAPFDSGSWMVWFFEGTEWFLGHET